MPLFVVVLLKKTSYNKETKREAENERRKTREVKVNKKEITTYSVPDSKFSLKKK